MKNKHIKPIAATVLTTSLLSFGLTTTVQAATKVPKVDQTAILKKGKLVKKSSGKVIKNFASFKGKVYKNGKIYSGKLNSKLYAKGKLANGFYSKKLYAKGVLFSGIHNKKFYKNGVKATGTHKGKYYSKGTIANGVIAKTYYKNGVKATATYKGVYYRNGKAYNGKLNSTIYKNGKVDHVATISFRSDKIQTTLKQYKLQAEYQQLAFQLAEKYGFADQSQTQKLQTKTAFIVTPDQVGNLRTLFQSGLVPEPKQQQQLDEVAQSGALSSTFLYPTQQILINNESSLNQSLGSLPPSFISSPTAEFLAALLKAQQLQLEKEMIHSSMIFPNLPSAEAIRGNQLLAEFGKVDELAKLNSSASFILLQSTLKAQQWTDDLTADSYVAFVRKALDEMKMPYTLTYKIENGKIIFDLQAFGQNESMTAVSDEMKALEATDALLNANSLTQNANDFTLSQAKLLAEKLKKEQLRKDLEEKQKKAAELLAANSPKFNQMVALINSFKWQPKMSQDEFQAAFEKFIGGLGLKDGISHTFKDNTFNFTYSSGEEKRDFATAAPWKAIEDQLMLILNNPNATKDQLNEAKKLLDALQNPTKKAELLNRVDVAIENLNPSVPPQPSDFDRIKTAVVKIEWDDNASPDQHMVKVKEAIKHLSGSNQVEYDVSAPYTLTVKLGSQSFTVKAGWLETEEKVRKFLEPENKTFENAVEIQRAIALIESKYPEVSKRLTDEIKSTIQIISNEKEQEIKEKADEFKWDDEESADAASTRFIEFIRQIKQEGIQFTIESTSNNNFHYSVTILGNDIPSSTIFAPWHLQQAQVDAFLINENSTVANAVNVKQSVDLLKTDYPNMHARLLKSIESKYDPVLVHAAETIAANFILKDDDIISEAADRFKREMAQHSIIVNLGTINDSAFQYTLDTIGPSEIYTLKISDYELIKGVVEKIVWEDNATSAEYMETVKEAIKNISSSDQVEYDVSSPYTLTVKLGGKSFTVKAGWLETEDKVKRFLEPENKTYENAVEIQRAIALIESDYPKVSARLTKEIESNIRDITNEKTYKITNKAENFKWLDGESIAAASTRFIEFMSEFEKDGIHFSIRMLFNNTFGYYSKILGHSVSFPVKYSPWASQQNSVDDFLNNKNSTVEDAVNVKKLVDNLHSVYPLTSERLNQEIKEKYDRVMAGAGQLPAD